MGKPIYPGGKCYWCKKELDGPSLTCANETICIDGVRYDRIRYGWEHWREGDPWAGNVEQEHKREYCSDCGVALGALHHFCCDNEQCPRCKVALLGCDCNEVTA